MVVVLAVLAVLLLAIGLLTAPLQAWAALPPGNAVTDPAAILRSAARDQWAALRAHAVEASIRTPKLLAELAPAALRDENRGVRFVACMAIAEAGITVAEEISEIPSIIQSKILERSPA